MSADADPRPASQRRDGPILFAARLISAILLALGCTAVPPAMAAAADSPILSIAQAVDEAPLAAAGSEVTRRRFERRARRFRSVLGRVVALDPTRLAHWFSPVQLRVMPPVWRRPTVLRL